MSVEKSNVMGVAFQRTAFNGVTCSTASVPPGSICCVLIEKNALRRTCRIELEAVEADFELAWREPTLELRAVHFCHDARVRPFAHPPMLFGIAVARSIDGHLLVLETERSSFPQDPACPQAIGDAFHQPSGPQRLKTP